MKSCTIFCMKFFMMALCTQISNGPESNGPLSSPSQPPVVEPVPVPSPVPSEPEVPVPSEPEAPPPAEVAPKFEEEKVAEVPEAEPQAEAMDVTPENVPQAQDHVKAEEPEEKGPVFAAPTPSVEEREAKSPKIEGSSIFHGHRHEVFVVFG